MTDTGTLIAVSRTSDGRYLITSPTIPEIVTEAQSPRDSIEHLEDALGLVLEKLDTFCFPGDAAPAKRLRSADGTDKGNFRSLVDVRSISEGRYLITSTLIPLVTEGRDKKDSLRELKDALGLLVEVDDNKKATDKILVF